MSFTLAIGNGGAIVGSDSALIKARDRAPFVEAVDMLERARQIVADATAHAGQVRDQARLEGLDDAAQAVRGALSEQVAQLADGLATELEQRRQETVATAFAAARAMLGSFDDETLVARLAAAAVDALPDDGTLTVAVAPAFVADVRTRLSGKDTVSVVGDPALSALAVEVRTRHGRVLAGLDVQLDRLATRWGLDRAA